MARSVNKCIFIGNVGRDPEIKTANSGTIIANFSIAVSDRQKDAKGEWKDVTEWVNLVAFKRTAEIVRDYVVKGSKLYIEGKLTTRNWEGNDGVKHYKTEILVNDVVLLSAKEENGRTDSIRAESNKKETTSDYDPSEVTDEDIPF